MARSDRVYKQACNDCLDLIAVGGELPSIAGLARRLGTSRTTVRRVLQRLGELGLASGGKNGRTILRAPKRGDYFSSTETQSTEKMIENAFMNWVLHANVQPLTRFREAELSRQFDVSNSALREFLIRFSRFGLIRKEPRRYWVFEGFTRELAFELSEVRELFELRAIRFLVELPEDDAIWSRIRALREDHLSILSNIEEEYMRFPRLDAQFHRTINAASENRFISDFQDLISIIFHYHYLWSKSGERERNKTAVVEHLACLNALIERNKEKACAALENHLATSRQTLVAAIDW